MALRTPSPNRSKKAEPLAESFAKGEGQGQQGCRCFECNLKELEMNAIRRDMAVER